MIRVGFRMALAYRSSLVMTVIALIAQVFLLRMIWTNVYGGSHLGFTLEELLAYLTLANLQGFATQMVVGRIVAWRVGSGTVFFDLARPVGYLRQMTAFQVGNTAASLLMLLPVIPVVLLVGSVTAPADLPGYLASLLLGYLIAVELALLVSMISFWTLEIGAVQLLFQLVSRFFAGAMVPLSFFPGFLGVLADVLPFKYLGFVPAGLYVGHLTDLPRVLAVEVAWVLGLWGLLALTWSRARRRVVIQGG
ncbi:ABC transporter permease [Nonomuraea sp. NPDC050328]|uniref:ABC transporter permease n=1 Tax=Nonomuraea sp. NPDC050328 TaxID=3364361 RepID=UPI0037B8A926